MSLTKFIAETQDLAWQAVAAWITEGIHWGRLTAEITRDEAKAIVSTPIRDLHDTVTDLGLRYSDIDRVLAMYSPSDLEEAR